jgi:hypothetical protein
VQAAGDSRRLPRPDGGRPSGQSRPARNTTYDNLRNLVAAQCRYALQPKCSMMRTDGATRMAFRAQVWNFCAFKQDPNTLRAQVTSHSRGAAADRSICAMHAPACVAEQRAAVDGTARRRPGIRPAALHAVVRMGKRSRAPAPTRMRSFSLSRASLQRAPTCVAHSHTSLHVRTATPTGWRKPTHVCTHVRTPRAYM